MTTINVPIEIPEALEPYQPVTLFASAKGWTPETTDDEGNVMTAEQYAIRFVKRMVRDEMGSILVSKSISKIETDINNLLG